MSKGEQATLRRMAALAISWEETYIDTCTPKFGLPGRSDSAAIRRARTNIDRFRALVATHAPQEPKP